MTHENGGNLLTCKSKPALALEAAICVGASRVTRTVVSAPYALVDVDVAIWTLEPAIHMTI